MNEVTGVVLQVSIPLLHVVAELQIEYRYNIPHTLQLSTYHVHMHHRNKFDKLCGYLSCSVDARTTINNPMATKCSEGKMNVCMEQCIVSM